LPPPPPPPLSRPIGSRNPCADHDALHDFLLNGRDCAEDGVYIGVLLDSEKTQRPRGPDGRRGVGGTGGGGGKKNLTADTETAIHPAAAPAGPEETC